MRAVSALLAFAMFGQSATPADQLTTDGLRAWLVAGGALESRDKVIHDLMQRKRSSVPPWWPDDVYAQEEMAQQKVDFVGTALPFYQACMTDPQARLLAKIVASKAGHQVAQKSLAVNSQAALQGASATAAQTAGEDAAARSVINEDDKQNMVASLTPQERKMAQELFTPAKASALRQCTDKAYAGTSEAMLAKQTAAVHAVIEANHAELVAAKTKWIKEHPGESQ